jgi:chloramphenicol-sensitive protein RarD
VAFDQQRLVGFVFIWVGLAVFALEGALRSRRPAVAAPGAPAQAGEG